MPIHEHRFTRWGLCSPFLFAFLSVTAQDSIKTAPKTEDAGNAASSSAFLEDNFTGQATGTEEKPAMPFSRNAYNLAVAEALSLQIKADSLSRMAREKRIIAQAIPDQDAKKEMMSEILSLEREADQVQGAADEKYLEARKMKNISDALPAGDSNLVLFKEINGIKVYQYRKKESADIPVTESEPHAVAGLINRKDQKTRAEDQSEIPENTPYPEENPIPPLPAGIHGLVYRIQLGVFSHSKEISSFGGLYPLYVDWLPEKKMYKYFTGGFTSTVSVTAALEKAREAGFPDAFVVAFLDGKPVSTEKAREIEFEELKL